MRHRVSGDGGRRLGGGRGRRVPGRLGRCDPLRPVGAVEGVARRRRDPCRRASAGAAAIAVDIPIGLPEPGADFRRRCDLQARDFLRPWATQSSVFFTPVRAVLGAGSYSAANALSRRLTGFGLSRQTWNILDRVAAIDTVLGETPKAPVIEVHPEVSFRILDPSIDTSRRAHVVPVNGSRPLPGSWTSGRLPTSLRDPARRLLGRSRGGLVGTSLVDEHCARFRAARRRIRSDRRARSSDADSGVSGFARVIDRR